MADTDNGENDAAEAAHWQAVGRAYRQYATWGQAQCQGRRARFSQLPAALQAHLPAQYNDDNNSKTASANDAFTQALIRNQFVLDCILRHAGQPHSQQQQTPTTEEPLTTEDYHSKVGSVLKSMARDWSTEGARERQQSYGRLVEQLQTYAPPIVHSSKNMRRRRRVCVPGGGLGRLACEICGRGYHVQGNEFSLFMLLASDFVLNHSHSHSSSDKKKPLQISPWLLESRNLHAQADALRAVTIPDVRPQDVLQGAMAAETNDDALPPPDFSMAAGDFNLIYQNPNEAGQWDAVVSCFFLDATPNIVETLQTIHHMLQPGGYLFNFGPLLWHWSGPPQRPDDADHDAYRTRCRHLDGNYWNSIDVTWEDVRHILQSIGFRLLFEETNVEATYTADARSMMVTTFRCVHFVAQKVVL